MSRLKEIAKFACGFMTFHTLSHAMLWWTGTTITVFGITETPTVHAVSAAVSVLIAAALGFYAWWMPVRRATPASRA